MELWALLYHNYHILYYVIVSVLKSSSFWPSSVMYCLEKGWADASDCCVINCVFKSSTSKNGTINQHAINQYASHIIDFKDDRGNR